MTQNQPEQIAAGSGSCDRPGCKCCASRIATEQMLYGLIDAVNDLLKRLAEKLAMDPDDFLQVLNGLVSEKQRYASLNRALNVEANGIRIATVKARKSSGRIGRPRGQKATINRRPENIDREETNDMTHCPDCGKAALSGWSDGYETVVRHMKIFWENVLHRVKRRYCRNCKTIVSARIPGRMRHARTTANYGALMTHLNIRGGVSHGKLATISCDALKRKTSRSSMYRSTGWCVILVHLAMPASRRVFTGGVWCVSGFCCPHDVISYRRVGSSGTLRVRQTAVGWYRYV